MRELEGADKIKQVFELYTRRISNLLLGREALLDVLLAQVIEEVARGGGLPADVEKMEKNARTVIFAYLDMYDFATKFKLPISELEGETLGRIVKEEVGYDFEAEVERMKKVILLMIDNPHEKIVTYLVDNFPLLGTGEIMDKKPTYDSNKADLINLKKWYFYLGAVVLNRCIKLERGRKV